LEKRCPKGEGGLSVSPCQGGYRAGGIMPSDMPWTITGCIDARDVWLTIGITDPMGTGDMFMEAWLPTCIWLVPLGGEEEGNGDLCEIFASRMSHWACTAIQKEEQEVSISYG